MSGPVDEEDFKRAMASFAAGVTVVTTIDDRGKPWGLTATAFSSVSKRPPICLVCVSHAAEALPALRATGRFAVNVLAKDQESISNQFAKHGIDKFEGLAWSEGPATRCPLVTGALASVECAVLSAVTAGDHDVFLGRVEHVRVDAAGEPLVYFRGRYADAIAR